MAVGASRVEDEGARQGRRAGRRLGYCRRRLPRGGRVRARGCNTRWAARMAGRAVAAIAGVVDSSPPSLAPARRSCPSTSTGETSAPSAEERASGGPRAIERGLGGGACLRAMPVRRRRRPLEQASSRGKVREQQRGDGLTEGRIGQFMLLKRKENGK